MEIDENGEFGNRSITVQIDLFPIWIARFGPNVSGRNLLLSEVFEKKLNGHNVAHVMFSN